MASDRLIDGCREASFRVALTSRLPPWPSEKGYADFDLTVTNPGGLAGQGSGSTVLTTSATSSPATVILDFGKEVGGTPFAVGHGGRLSASSSCASW